MQSVTPAASREHPTSIYIYIYIYMSKLPFWSLRFGQFCHFSPNLKPFTFGSLWFQFYCHFGPNIKADLVCLTKPFYFVLFLKGKMVL
ncbi:hypothetical protein Hanom_Chr07g00616701 [Helianthus anomalus]